MKLERALDQHKLIDVVYIDEFRTSQRCSKCFMQLIFCLETAQRCANNASQRAIGLCRIQSSGAKDWTASGAMTLYHHLHQVQQPSIAISTPPEISNTSVYVRSTTTPVMWLSVGIINHNNSNSNRFDLIVFSCIKLETIQSIYFERSFLLFWCVKHLISKINKK